MDAGNGIDTSNNQIFGVRENVCSIHIVKNTLNKREELVDGHFKHSNTSQKLLFQSCKKLSFLCCHQDCWLGLI